MKRYKLLTQDGYAEVNFKSGEVYDETAKSEAGTYVSQLVDAYPEDWQLIEEKQEKRPIMTYIILSVMMALYIYEELAEVNWPLIRATILVLYVLIKNERNGRKKIL